MRREFWDCAVRGALSRSATYETKVEKERRGLRDALHKCVCELEVRLEAERSSAEELLVDHLDQACKLISRDYSRILHQGRFRLGSMQKLSNLYLKYLWCSGLADEPPHFPIDGVILKRIGGFQMVSWTQLDSIDTYSQIVSAARAIAEKEGLSLAEWELREFAKGRPS